MFSSGERRCSGLAVLSFLLWLAWAASGAAAPATLPQPLDPQPLERVLLHTDPEVLAECGRGATLRCEASSSRLIVIEMTWVAPDLTVLCTAEKRELEGGAACRRPDKHSLVLALSHVTPSQGGQYTCRLRANIGAWTDTTTLKVPECPPGESHHFRNRTHIECVFRGFYPRSAIHWFQDADNLTQSATTRTVEGPDGLFNVTSALPIHGRDATRLYRCSLWSPAAGKHRLHQEIPAAASGEGAAGPERIPALWMGVLVGLLLVNS